MDANQARDEARRIYAVEICDCHGKTAADDAIKIIQRTILDAERRGYERCKNDNALLNEIRNEQFELGKKQGFTLAKQKAVEFSNNFGTGKEKRVAKAIATELEKMEP